MSGEGEKGREWPTGIKLSFKNKPTRADCEQRLPDLVKGTGDGAGSERRPDRHTPLLSSLDPGAGHLLISPGKAWFCDEIAMVSI